MCLHGLEMTVFGGNPGQFDKTVCRLREPDPVGQIRRSVEHRAALQRLDAAGSDAFRGEKECA
jgi:hypothetical protein